MLIQTESKTTLPDLWSTGVRNKRKDRWPVNFITKPAYRVLGVHVTMIPDALYPYDERLLRAIWTYDSSFVPIFRRMAYRTPGGGLLTFIHHGVARYDRNAQPEPAIVHCSKPTSGPVAHLLSRLRGAPNVVERWFEGPVIRGSVRDKNNLPAPYVPFTEWVLRWVEETFWAATSAEKRRYTEEQEAKQEAELDRAVAREVDDSAYRAKHETPRQKRALEEWTEDDTREELALQRGEAWYDTNKDGERVGPIRTGPKPFVHLPGKSAGVA